MSVGFRVSGSIGKLVAEAFDAVVNPTKLGSCFTMLGGVNAPPVTGTAVSW